MKIDVLLGSAGTGKSYTLQKRLEEDSSYAVLTSSTGVSAINLGPNVTTINSLLGFFDLDSLRESLADGRLTRRITAITKSGYKNLVLDEVSMFSGDHLDTIMCAWEQVAREREMAGNCMPGLILTGDFLQLPPVNGNFAFQGKHWEGIKPESITVLTKNYRQSNPKFLEVLLAARRGMGVSAAKGLLDLGVKFVDEPDRQFEGTTLFPVNQSVDKHNRETYATLPGIPFSVENDRWGTQKSEWSQIPSTLELKDGALCMCLANSGRGNGDSGLRYANGTLGRIKNADKRVDGLGIGVGIDLEVQDKTKPEGSKVVTVTNALRTATVREKPFGDVIEYTGPQKPGSNDEPLSGDQLKIAWARFFDCYEHYCLKSIAARKPFFDPLLNRWVTGWINYMPLRLGYALTIHKAQGLTLDRVQIDSRARPAGNHGLMYVALSRVKAHEGLQIVGNVSRFAERVSTNPEVRRWI